MNAYIYDADIYCEDCGKAIQDELRKDKDLMRRKKEGLTDSDDWPEGPYPHGGGEADGPQHCGTHEGCLNEIRLEWKGKPAGKVSVFLENPLTDEGVRYLCEMVSERGSSPYQKAVHKLWLDYYRRHGYGREIANCVRERMKGE